MDLSPVTQLGRAPQCGSTMCRMRMAASGSAGASTQQLPGRHAWSSNRTGAPLIMAKGTLQRGQLPSAYSGHAAACAESDGSADHGESCSSGRIYCLWKSHVSNKQSGQACSKQGPDAHQNMLATYAAVHRQCQGHKTSLHRGTQGGQRITTCKRAAGVRSGGRTT